MTGEGINSEKGERYMYHVFQAVPAKANTDRDQDQCYDPLDMHPPHQHGGCGCMGALAPLILHPAASTSSAASSMG